MSINKPLFDTIYKKCLSIITNSSDININNKQGKLCAAYKKLCKTEDHELQEFYSVVHELRLYQYIKDLGITVSALNDNKAGPDFITDLGYIECVSATKGLKGLPERNYLEKQLKQSMNRYVSAIPRLSSVIADKAKKYGIYLKDNVSNEKIPRIIAINTSIFSNEFHYKLNLDNILKILYGIGCRTMNFAHSSNGFVEERGVETYAYEEVGEKPPRNVILPFNLFFKNEYVHISGVIVNNNAISEELEKDCFCLLLNPNASIPINISRLQGIKYFTLSEKDAKYIKYSWLNQ
ncbi:MAG: hypothetical protein ACLSUT_00005 [Christensenellales bacterium]